LITLSACVRACARVRVCAPRRARRAAPRVFVSQETLTREQKNNLTFILETQNILGRFF
jgi:hypothetical protein